MNTQEVPEVMTVDQLMVYAGVRARKTIYRWIKTGGIPVERAGLGGGWRFRKAAVDQWLAENGRKAQGIA